MEAFESDVAESAHIGAGVMIDDDGAAYESGTIYMATGTAGYVGLVRVEGMLLNIAAALDPAARPGRP